MSIWDTCPACVQFGIDHPAVYDAIVARAEAQGRDTLAVTFEFFKRYHDHGHPEETAA